MIINELFLLGGAKLAEQAAREFGLAELAQKIRFGQFAPNRKGFGPARARARSEALAWLARKGLTRQVAA